MTPALHAVLWESNRDLAHACRQHPFVTGLERGDLDVDAFRRYVAQDAFFLTAFARAYALAAARCTSIGDIESFHALQGGVIDELRTHAAYARTLAIDLDGVAPFPETLAYTEFLLETAWTAGLGEILAAMTPCMRLYAHLGQALAGAGLPDHAYREWIATYSDPGFEALAALLEARLDDWAADTAAVRDAYRRAMQCEVDFFSAPLR